MDHILVERDAAGHWTASLERFPVAYGGQTSAEALRRLLDGMGWDAADVRPHPGSEDGRLVFQRVKPKCPECGDRGVYVGLYVTEPCQTCGGID